MPAGVRSVVKINRLIRRVKKQIKRTTKKYAHQNWVRG